MIFSFKKKNTKISNKTIMIIKSKWKKKYKKFQEIIEMTKMKLKIIFKMKIISSKYKLVKN